MIRLIIKLTYQKQLSINEGGGLGEQKHFHSPSKHKINEIIKETLGYFLPLLWKRAFELFNCLRTS